MKQKQSRQPNKKVMHNAKVFGALLLVGAFFVMVLMVGRLFKIAAFKDVNHHDLNQATRSTFMQQETVPATRGKILDQTGQVLADNATVYDLYAVLDKKQFKDQKPAYVVDKRGTADKLAPILGLDANDIYRQLTSDHLQVELGPKAKNLSVDQYKQIQALKLPGIYFNSQPARYYPNNRMASHLLGLTSYNSNKVGQRTLQGVLGVEAFQNKALRGSDGLQLSLGNQVETSKENQVKNGENVTLNLDEKLQATLENRMNVLFDQTKAKSASAFLMEAKTGKIVAATQRPNFDPNTQDGLSNSWENALNQGAFEPGSTMKTMTLAAAIQEGKWHPDDTYQSGVLDIDGQKVVDAFGRNEGVLSFRQAYWRSSNVGFAKIEQSLGAKTWRSYLDKFHFLKKTGIDLPQEETGSISFDQPIDQANTAYGQAIRVTPAQLLQAYSAFANNGKMVKPYIVDRRQDARTGKTTYQAKTETVGQPISKATAQTVLDNMEGVVNEQEGTAKQYDLRDAGYQVAAKTGTAQIAEKGHYLDGLTNAIHSVMAIVPKDNPQYIMYLSVRQPATFPDPNIQITLNKVFRPVMLQALNDGAAAVKSKNNQVTLPKVTGQTVEQASKTLQDAGLRVATVGQSGKVKAQTITAGQQAQKGQLIVLTAAGETKVPDFSGWTKNEVLTWAKLADAKISFKGSGYVSEQNHAANSFFKEGEELAVVLKERE